MTNVFNQFNLENAPGSWSNLRSPCKEDFIANLFRYHISINNQFSKGALDFLSFLTKNITHYPHAPSDGLPRLRDGTVLDENGYNSDGDHYSSSDEEVERYEPYDGPRDGISYSQQRVLYYIKGYSMHMRKLLPYECGNINQLEPWEIRDWLDSAQRLHFCALMCFTNQQGNNWPVGTSFLDHSNQTDINQIIQDYIPIPSPKTNNEVNLDRSYGGIEQCQRVLHMFANNASGTSQNSGSEIIAYTKKLIRVVHQELLNRRDLSSQTRVQLATSGANLVFDRFQQDIFRSLRLEDLFTSLTNDPTNKQLQRDLNLFADSENWIRYLFDRSIDAVNPQNFLFIWHAIDDQSKRDDFLTSYYHSNKRRRKVFSQDVIKVLELVTQNHPSKMYKQVLSHIITISKAFTMLRPVLSTRSRELSIADCKDLSRPRLAPISQTAVYELIEAAQKLSSCALHCYQAPANQPQPSSHLQHRPLNESIPKLLECPHSEPIYAVASIVSAKSALKLFDNTPCASQTSSNDICYNTALMLNLVYRALSFRSDIDGTTKELLMESSEHLTPNLVRQFGLSLSEEFFLSERDISLESKFYYWAIYEPSHPEPEPFTCFQILEKAIVENSKLLQGNNIISRIAPILARFTDSTKNERLIKVVKHYKIPVVLNPKNIIEPQQINLAQFYENYVEIKEKDYSSITKSDLVQLIRPRGSEYEISQFTAACAHGSVELVEQYINLAKTHGVLDQMIDPGDATNYSAQDRRCSDRPILHPLEGACNSGNSYIASLLFDHGLKMRSRSNHAQIPCNMRGSRILPAVLQTGNSRLLEIIATQAKKDLSVADALNFFQDGVDTWVHIPIRQGHLLNCILLHENGIGGSTNQRIIQRHLRQSDTLLAAAFDL